MELEQPAVPGMPVLRWTPRRLLPVSDDRLAQLVKAGHEQAFAALYERYHQRLYRYCRSILGNESDAQDALQSAFAGAFVALAQGRRDAPVRPWLYRIVHNEAISALRRRRPAVEISEEHLDPGASAADVADQRSRLALLMADLAALTDRQRSALVMRELSGLSHTEIATALTIDVAAAKQTIFEARRSLQEFAEGRAMVCDDVCRAISDGGGRTLRGRRIKAHLRDCRGCAAFAAAIPSRSGDLRAIAPPIAGFAAVSILRRALASTSSQGAGGGAGVAASTAGKAAGMLTAGKALAGAAAVASLAVGAGSIAPSVGHPSPVSPRPSSRPVSHVVASQAGGGAPSAAADASPAPARPASLLTRRAGAEPRIRRAGMSGEGHSSTAGRGRSHGRHDVASAFRTGAASPGRARGHSFTGASSSHAHRSTSTGSTHAHRSTQSGSTHAHRSTAAGSSQAASHSRSWRRASASVSAPRKAGSHVNSTPSRSGADTKQSTVQLSSAPAAQPKSHGVSALRSIVSASTHQHT